MNKTLNLLIVSLLCMLTAPGMVFARRGGGPGNPVDLAYDAGYRAGLDNNALPVIPIIIGVIVAVAVGVAIGYWVRSRKMAIID